MEGKHLNLNERALALRSDQSPDRSPGRLRPGPAVSSARRWRSRRLRVIVKHLVKRERSSQGPLATRFSRPQVIQRIQFSLYLCSLLSKVVEGLLNAILCRSSDAWVRLAIVSRLV